MRVPPKKGAVFVASQIAPGMMFYVDDVELAESGQDGQDKDDFFKVTVVEQSERGDVFALGAELDPDEWIDFIGEYGLVEKNVA